MIPFAGYDPTEDRRQFSAATEAFELFRDGMDTFDIARRLRISEARALKLVNLERSAIIHKPVPYGVE